MKTILHLIETAGPGGAEKMLANLVSSLDSTRFRPLVCLLKEGWLSRHLRDLGHTVIVIPLRSTLDLHWLREARDLLRREQVAVMHAHEFYMNCYCAMLARMSGVPCIATVHGRNYSADKFYRRAAYRSVSRNTRMIAVSTGIRDFLSHDVGIAPYRLTVVRNGIDCATFAPDWVARQHIRKEFGVQESTPVIGCLGNLYPIKGHTHLVAAAARIVQRHPGALLFFAGRGDQLSGLQRQVEELKIQNNVRFLGFREDSSALLSAMDVYVMPSLYEGLPLSLLEAMAAQKPIVASNVGGIPEVIVHGHNGLLARPADSADLAEQILRVVENPAEAKQLALNARQDVTRDFDISGMTNAYSTLYDSLSARS